MNPKKGTKKYFEYELGRYKKAVGTRDIVIDKLKEEIAGHIEIEQILAAYICALIEGRPENKFVVSKDMISKNIGECKLMISENEEKDSYIIDVIRNEPTLE